MAERPGWWTRFRELPNDSPVKTLAVTLAVALIGSILVAGSAVLLRPLQIANKEAERQRHMIEIARLLPGAAEQLAAADGIRLEGRVVDLKSGLYLPSIEPSRYDQRRAASAPEQSVEIPPALDIAGLKRRARYAVVYLVWQEGRLRLFILPVRGRGYATGERGYPNGACGTGFLGQSVWFVDRSDGDRAAARGGAQPDNPGAVAARSHDNAAGAGIHSVGGRLGKLR